MEKLLKNVRLAFLKDVDAVQNLALGPMANEPLGRFVEGLVAQTKCAKVHRDKDLGI